MLDTIVRRATQKASVEKAVLGPGAAVMSWGTPIADITRDESRVLRDALTVYRTNRWINRAESVISSRVGGVKWHLEDDQGNEVNDDSPEELRRIRDVFEKPLADQQMASAYPSQPSTRRSLWGVTSRHMGLCNVGFWHLDELDRAMGFPKRIFYIRPDRITPDVKGGTLTGWKLDAQADGGGTSLSLEEILPFYLDQPDKGFFGVGLPESIWATLSMPSAIDGHALDTLGSGGRLAGVYAPKTEPISDEIFNRLSGDLRVVKDMPDSAKRDIVAKVPLEFTPTAADMASLNVILLSQMSRDDTLTHWGVPLSTIGGQSAGGLNSGDSRKYDEAALWQNAVQFRVDALKETIQLRLLDRLQAVGMYLSLEIDVPEFDDNTPKYAMANDAINLPLRNVERRALLGLDPFGDPALDNAVWMPVGLTELALAPAAAGAVEPPQKEEPKLSARDAEAVGVLLRAGFTPEDSLRQLGLPPIAHTGLLPVTLQPQKARLDRMVAAVREHSSKQIERDVKRVLADMKADIAARVRAKGGQLARKPSDYQLWLPASKRKEWEQALAKALNPHLSLAAETLAVKVEQEIGTPGKAKVLGSAVLSKLMKSVGKRIGGIIDTTRDDIQRVIAKGLDDGLGASELGDLIESATTFDEYRAELIARTETAAVLNQAAIESYREYGVERVRAIDGDSDEECAARDGQEFDLDEALDIEDHPNGTLDWVPVV